MASRCMASFNSPGDAANGCRRPASVLLNEEAYIADFRIDQPPDIADDSNETSATAKSKGGHTMAVSFWVADPPHMSFFSVVCSESADPVYKRPGFRISPHVVGAEGRFVLLRANFFSRYGKDELFMYTAGGDAESPSLERVPLPDDDDGNVGCLHRVKEFGIVPRGLHYLVAALCDSCESSLDYQLHVYSSESRTWSSRVLPNTWVKIMKPEKVITLGEGVLGWVDFSHGLLVYNLFHEQLPSPRFIPLPRPCPGNKDKLRVPEASPRLFRDLTCVDGKIKFIEMEHGTEKPSDPCDDDVLYDSDLIRLLEDDMDGKPKLRHGWRTVTWSRTVSSNYWRKECVVDVADIVVDESAYSLLLSGLGETAGNLKFRDLYSDFPTLSIDSGDILYLKSSVEPSDRNGWVVTVDLGNKKVKAFRPHPFQKRYPTDTVQAFRTSTLSSHLVITPGNVSFFFPFSFLF